MSDWTAGYVADIGYTFGYYSELNPLHVKQAFLSAGLVYPEFGTACELGFGQGVSANMHAAASVTSWYGTDFNPSQASFAQEMAASAGAGARLYDESFEQFANRTDLPEFDYIGLHGIWSWVSNENRDIIVDFVRRKLKVGGVLYISYNTQPGWAAFAPMRHLLNQHADIIGAEGKGILNRIDDALGFADRLLATNPRYSAANPGIGDRIKALQKQNRQYLAHEYFNRDWHPMHFATLAEWLEPAKLQYACSAHYPDHVSVISLTAEQSAFLAEIPDPMFRETVRDFMVNQQFRRDYWVKGSRKITPVEKIEGLRALRVMLVAPVDDVELFVNGAAGKANLNADIYRPVLEKLASANHAPVTLGELEKHFEGTHINLGALEQVALVLAGKGVLCAAHEDAVIKKAKPQAAKLNAYILQKARVGTDIGCLASPVIGGGVAVDRVQQYFLLGLQHGAKTPADLAKGAWQILSSLGQRLVKDETTLETAEQNLAELTARAEKFVQRRLPILKTLQVA